MTEESEIERDLPRSAPGPAPGQSKKIVLFHGNAALFKSQRVAFWKSIQANVKNIVFLSQEALFEERSSPMSLLPGPEATKIGKP